MKKKINQIVKHFKKNPIDGAILALSVLILIIGSVAIGFIKTFLIVLALDLLLIGIPILYNKIKHKKPKSQSKSSYSNTKPKTTYKKKSKGKTVLKWFLIGCFSLFIVGFVCLCGFAIYIVATAPDFDPKKLYQQQSTILYDNQGKIITTLGVEKREIISYDQMPEVFVNAVIATEDARFFQHNGFDLPRFTVATMKQLMGNSGAGGASTLTMQVSKNHFTSREADGIKGIVRKFTDIYMSIFVIEKKYTKEEIFEFYVNSNFLGSNSYGVEQACQTYFGKSTKDINLAEAALIAGLFQAPTSYDPNIYPENAEDRRQTVLYLMERHGYITKEEKEAASKLTVDKLLKKSTSGLSEFQGFIDTVIDDVTKTTGQNPYKIPMEIHTTMDRTKQKHINNIMNGKTFTWENKVVQSGVAVIDNHTGAVVAVGSGRNKDRELGFNFATQTEKQIGSTAKPLYDYAPGIEYNNWSTYEPFVDEPYSYSDGTKVNNWDGGYSGFMTMRDALAQSRNIPALKAFQKVDNKKITKFVKSVGLHPEEQNGQIHEAHAIGAYTGESPLSMAAAYSSFATGGYYQEPHSFSKIVYRDNSEEYEVKTQKEKVMSPETAYMINDMLVDTANVAVGYYSNVNGIKYAAKSGTTNFDDDAFKKYNLPYGAINDLWVVGYTPDYSISVWYGYDKINNKYVSIFGNSGHQEVFQAVAKGVFKQGSKFTKPSGVVSVNLERYSAKPVLASKYTPNSMIVTELFKKGTEPTETSNAYKELDNVTNLQSSISGSTLNLSWNKVQGNPIDRNQLITAYKPLFANTGTLNSFVSGRISYNQSIVGSLGYNIYKKTSSGLTKIGYTTNSNYKVNLLGENGNVTYVVKTTYSKLSTMASSGSEITVDVGNHVVAPVTVSLSGESSININVGDTYVDPNPPVIVLENAVDVTSKATITSTITKQGTNEVVTSIDTTTAGSYTITYIVEYKTNSETITRVVNVN